MHNLLRSKHHIAKTRPSNAAMRRPRKVRDCMGWGGWELRLLGRFYVPVTVVCQWRNTHCSWRWRGQCIGALFADDMLLAASQAFVRVLWPKFTVTTWCYIRLYSPFLVYTKMKTCRNEQTDRDKYTILPFSYCVAIKSIFSVSARPWNSLYLLSQWHLCLPKMAAGTLKTQIGHTEKNAQECSNVTHLMHNNSVYRSYPLYIKRLYWVLWLTVGWCSLAYIVFLYFSVLKI